MRRHLVAILGLLIVLDRIAHFFDTKYQGGRLRKETEEYLQAYNVLRRIQGLDHPEMESFLYEE